jgi:hypothetical protein
LGDLSDATTAFAGVICPPPDGVQPFMKHAPALAFVVATVIAAGCAKSQSPRVDSATLTREDVNVLRIVLDSAMRSRLAGWRCRDQDVAVTSTTLLSPLAEKRSMDAPAPVPPLPPPPFQQEFAPTLADRGPVGTQEHVPAERAAWQAANTRQREIPDLGLKGFSTGRNAQPDSCPTISLTAPAYPTAATAIVYADFVCGGLCGEGWLIRLARSAGQWVVTQQQMVLIR